MAMIEIDVTLSQQMEAIALTHENAFKTAINRATRKLGRYLRTHIARAAAHSLKMQVSKFKDYRIRVRFNRQTGIQEVWIGTNPIAAHHLKNPRWKRTWAGAKAGGRMFEGTFIAQSKTSSGQPNGLKVFRRKAGYYTRTGKTVLEVEKLPVHEEIAEIIQRLERRAQQRFVALMHQELNYVLAQSPS